MTSQEFMQFLSTRRTYRRFAQTPVPEQAVNDLLEAARIASCAANRQTIRYLVVQSPRLVQETGRHVHWAAYLPPEQGTPGPDQQPTLYLAIYQDTSLPGCSDLNIGLALGSMTAAAWAHGVGSCILGAIDRPALTALYGQPEQLKLCNLVAFGYPLHKSHLVPMQQGDERYYLDENRDFCVPKRPMSEIVLGRI